MVRRQSAQFSRRVAKSGGELLCSTCNYNVANKLQPCIGQNGDGIGFEACTRRVTGFELAIKDNGGEREFLSWQAELGAKEYLVGKRGTAGRC
jgi:hypothetical protein